MNRKKTVPGKKGHHKQKSQSGRELSAFDRWLDDIDTMVSGEGGGVGEVGRALPLTMKKGFQVQLMLVKNFKQGKNITRFMFLISL